MSAGKPATVYVVHFRSGGRSEPVDVEQARALIAAGEVGVEDLVSRNGGPAVEYYQYDEFMDLWDVEASFDFLVGGGEAEPSGPVATAAGGTSRAAGSAAGQATADDVAAREPAWEAESTDPEVGPGWDEPLAEDLEFGDELEPDAFGTWASEDGAGFGELDDSDPLSAEADGLAIIAFDEIDAVADGLQEPPATDTLAEEPEDAWGAALEAVPVDSLSDFEGYDPLADLVLDAVTVRDLLYDSSLYTVLAANPDDRGAQIQTRYLARADLLASRQRALPRSDREQVAATQALRRLVYQAYRVLADERRRSQYEATSKGRGRPASAARFLGLEQEEPQEAAVPAPADLIAESLAQMPSDAYEAVGERAAALGLTDEQEKPEEEGDDPFGIGEELNRRRARDPLRRAVDFSDEHGPAAGTRQSDSLPEGFRVYSGVHDTIESRSYDDLEPVGEIFERRVPDVARLARRTAEQQAAVSGQRTGTHTRPVSHSFDTGKAYPTGLRWGVEDTSAPAVTQVLGVTAVAFFVSLVIIFVTDLGGSELDYNGNSWWFYGRGLLLIGLALFGTRLVRGEPVTRLGLVPPIIETVMGLGLGCVLGLAGSLVAPIYLDEGANLGTAVVSMIFIAVAHEAFFRGFVTRVLLVGLRNPYSAIALSCLIYGSFYLSYTWVLGQPGVWLVYYSVLLFGFGLGSVYAVLYWKSRSIWPGVSVHFLVLVFATVLAP